MTLLMAGQVLSACAQPLFTNMPPKLAMVWFPAYQRALADTIASLSATIGAAIGFLLPTSFDIQTMLYIQAGWSVLVVLLAVCVFEGAPPIPSSPEGHRMSAGYWHELVMALRNRQFLCLLVAFSCGLGSFNTLSTLAEALTAPFGFSTEDASNFGVFTIVFGIVGAAIMTTVVGATQKYRQTLLFCLGLATCFGALLAWSVCSLKAPGLSVVNIAFAGLGFGAVPVMPVAFEAAVRVAGRSTGEGTLAGLCMSGGNLLGLALTLLVGELLKRGLGVVAWLTALVLFLVAVLAMLPFKAEGGEGPATALDSESDYGSSQTLAHHEGQAENSEGEGSGSEEAALRP